MDFIFMLTRDDRTVTDCLEVVAQVTELGLRHIGFKDIGVDAETLARLNTAIQDAGATSYLEVVATSREAALTSAGCAVDIGVDHLLGGTWIDETLALLHGTSIEYHPFAGRPKGHPTILHGTPADVAADCARFQALGCAGVDLLAYRAGEADPLDLVRAARKATDGRLIVAGSVTSANQIEALAAAGADAFTIGSAIFAGTVAPRAGLLSSQLNAVEAFLSHAAQL